MGYDGTLKFDTSINTTGFSTGVNKISSVASTALKATTGIIVGVTAGVVGIGAAAVKVGSEFESAMSQVQAISGATSDELELLTAKAKEMGASTKFSATESANAFYYMAMAGWETEEMLEGIEGIMYLAAASGEELATVSDIVTDALTAFGLEASDATHFSDVLAQTAASANTNVSIMGESFKYVGTMAGSLGYSIEDVSVALGLMANSGLKGSMAGTSLNQIFTRLSTNTSNARDAIEELGVSFYDSEGNARDLGDVLEELREATKDLNDEQKSQLANTIAGTTGQKGLLAILNATDEEYYSLADAIENADGAAQEMAETMEDNLQGQLTILQSALEGLGIELYEEMAEPMTDIVVAAQDMVNDLNDAFQDGGLDALVTKAAEIMDDIVQEVADAVPEMVDKAETLITEFITAILSNSEEITSAAADIVSTLAVGIINAVRQMWTAGIVLLRQFLEGLVSNADEIGQAAGALISQLKNCIINNLPLIIQAGKDIIKGFFEGMSEELPGISALLGGFFEGLVGAIGAEVEAAVKIISGLFDAINNADPDVMKAVGEALGVIAGAMISIVAAKNAVDTIKGLSTAFSAVSSVASGVVGFGSKIVEVFSLVAGGAGTLNEALSTVFGTAGTVIAGVASIVIGAVMAISSFVDMFKNGISAVKELIMGIGTALIVVGAIILGAAAWPAVLVAAIAFAVANIVLLIKNHWEEIVSFFQGIIQTVGEIVTSIIDWFKQLPEKVSEICEEVKTFFQELPGKILEFLTQIISNIAEWGAQLYENMTSFVSQAIDAVIQFFVDLPYNIGYAIGLVIGTLISWAAEVIAWITTNIPLIIESIVTFFTELPGKIAEWLTETWNKFIDWGAAMLERAGQIASDCVDAIINFFVNLPDNLLALLTTALNNLIAWGRSLLSAASTAASNCVTAIVNFFRNLPSNIATILANALSAVINWGRNLISAGREAAASLVTAVVDGIKNLPSQMVQIGYNIVMGVWQGIKNAASWFKQQVNNFFSGIVDGVKNALGINSPSKVFAEEVGEWIPPGVGVGFEDTLPELEDDMDAELDDLVKDMQASVNLETRAVYVQSKAKTQHAAVTESGGTSETTNDNHIEQTNNYYVPVPTPSETSRAQREAARKLVGGVA